jgi:GT2 family glycosyltransferase
VTCLSILIVSFNARVDLVNCLLSLKKNPPSLAHEIIVIDNASTDGSPEAAQKIPGVRVIQMERNAGFAAANNAGIAVSRGDVLLLLNSDTLVPPGAPHHRRASPARASWTKRDSPSCHSAG